MTTPRHVYVHVPFCARRCSYCDFAIAVRRDVPWRDFVDGVTRELDARLGAALGPPPPVDTLYVGGGTPSHLGPDGVSALLDALRARLDLGTAREVTLEANPEDVTPDAARAWRDAGIDRVSLGAQSFDPRVLQWMHRLHDAHTIERAIDTIRATGFTSWSFDLIFAVPEALGRDWRADLERALAAEPPHLSLYGLTVEAGTPLGRWVDRGEATPADEERWADEFLAADAAAVARGYDHYEVSNFARPGHHAVHNRAYWRGVPYLGAGPSAHGFDGSTRRWNVAAYAAWLAAVRAGRDPVAGEERLDPAARSTEDVYLGLRTTAGLVLHPDEAPVVAPWIAAGWAEQRPDGRLVCTPQGWLRLDALAATLTRHRDPA
ncbi:MAG: radical SAM family heme chaperone HemW [Gemmatimonadaceae bacterium]|jgi:oxygen-independent coproporphyrinogen-3 oxidase|nr:radical SAM family heme chaperone HemW [Gemmatimonadaceae bacterium]